MDISGNIHCVLNNINKIILAQKLETFLTNILSRDIFVVANKKECEKIVKKWVIQIYQTQLGIWL